MASDADIRIQLVLQAQDALIKAREFTGLIDKLKPEMINIAKQSGSSFAVVAKSMTEAHKKAQNLTDIMQRYGVSIQDARKIAKLEQQQFAIAAKMAAAALQKQKVAAGALGGAFSKLGGIIKNAFSFLLGGSVLIFLTRLISGFKELIEVGEEYATTIYRLSVSINQLQRRGLDITIKSEIELIKELRKQYDVFSTKSIIGAVSAVQMLTRNFGFNQEQIKKTIQLSMDLALVQGKDVAETAKQLALFYSSGYGEGLQHAGLAVNRLTVMQEAHRMGIEKSYMQLTEIERATAAYNLVTRQSVDLHEDAAKIQESVIGQIKEQRSAIEDITNEIALKALPVELAWLKLKLKATQVTYEWIRAEELRREYLKQQNLPFLPFLKMPGEAEYVTKKLEEERAKWEEILSETLDVSPDLNLDITGGEDQAAEELEKLGERIIEVFNDITDAERDYANKSEELESDHIDKLNEIDQDGIEKLKDLWQEYQDDLLDIQKDLDRDIADLWTDYYRELSDIDNDYQTSIQDSNRKHRENEIKAERDYQETMRRLREEFLFDLEDALRERDALQVLRLIRRYNLDKEQETRGYEEKKQDEDRQHKQDLEDLRRQNEEKRREAYESLQQQIADANLAAERKREDALADYDQALIDAKDNWQKLTEEENAHYAERQADLEKDLQDRKDKILEAFGEEIGTTGTSLDQVAKLFAAYLGDQGVVAGVIDQYIATLSNAAIETDAKVQSMMAALSSLSALSATIPQPQGTNVAPNALNPTPGTVWTGGHASGATNMVLTRPKLIMAGEVPERVDITPLNQLGGNGSGKGKLEILLGAGLEGRIVDNALGQVEIVLRKELERH